MSKKGNTFEEVVEPMTPTEEIMAEKLADRDSPSVASSEQGREHVASV